MLNRYPKIPGNDGDGSISWGGAREAKLTTSQILTAN
jgi:hypothetical protein